MGSGKHIRWSSDGPENILILKSGHAAALPHFFGRRGAFYCQIFLPLLPFQKALTKLSPGGARTDTVPRMERQADNKDLPALSAFLPNWIHAVHSSRLKGMFIGQLSCHRFQPDTVKGGRILYKTSYWISGVSRKFLLLWSDLQGRTIHPLPQLINSC